jgi:hypothetical protein
MDSREKHIGHGFSLILDAGVSGSLAFRPWQIRTLRIEPLE